MQLLSPISTVFQVINHLPFRLPPRLVTNFNMQTEDSKRSLVEISADAIYYKSEIHTNMSELHTGTRGAIRKH